METGFSASTRDATIETISCNDTWASPLYNHLWAISKSGSHYTFKNGAITDKSYLASSSNSTIGESVFTAGSTSAYSN